MASTLDAVRTAAVRSITVMADGDRSDFDQPIAPGAVDHESAVEPPACRLGGPEGFHATALWLRSAFADLDTESSTS